MKKQKFKRFLSTILLYVILFTQIPFVYVQAESNTDITEINIENVNQYAADVSNNEIVDTKSMEQPDELSMSENSKEFKGKDVSANEIEVKGDINTFLLNSRTTNENQYIGTSYKGSCSNKQYLIYKDGLFIIESGKLYMTPISYNNNEQQWYYGDTTSSNWEETLGSNVPIKRVECSKEETVKEVFTYGTGIAYATNSGVYKLNTDGTATKLSNEMTGSNAHINPSVYGVGWVTDKTYLGNSLYEYYITGAKADGTNFRFQVTNEFVSDPMVILIGDYVYLFDYCYVGGSGGHNCLVYDYDGNLIRTISGVSSLSSYHTQNILFNPIGTTDIYAYNPFPGFSSSVYKLSLEDETISTLNYSYTAISPDGQAMTLAGYDKYNVETQSYYRPYKIIYGEQEIDGNYTMSTDYQEFPVFFDTTGTIGIKYRDNLIGSIGEVFPAFKNINTPINGYSEERIYSQFWLNTSNIYIASEDEENNDFSILELTEMNDDTNCEKGGTVSWVSSSNRFNTLIDNVSYTNHIITELCIDKGNCVTYPTYQDGCDKCGKLTGESYIDDSHYGQCPDFYSEQNVTKAPTCLEAGTRSLSCLLCDERYWDYNVSDTIIQALGHNWGDWIIDEESTCKENGTKHRKCIVCETEESNIIKCTGHDWEILNVKAEATCSSYGLADVKCKKCGLTINEYRVAPPKHKWIDEVIYTEEANESVFAPHFTEQKEVNGEKIGDYIVKHTCEDCDYTYTDYAVGIDNDYGWYYSLLTADYGETDVPIHGYATRRENSPYPEGYFADETESYQFQKAPAELKILGEYNCSKVKLNGNGFTEASINDVLGSDYIPAELDTYNICGKISLGQRDSYWSDGNGDYRYALVGLNTEIDYEVYLDNYNIDYQVYKLTRTGTFDFTINEILNDCDTLNVTAGSDTYYLFKIDCLYGEGFLTLYTPLSDSSTFRECNTTEFTEEYIENYTTADYNGNISSYSITIDGMAHCKQDLIFDSFTCYAQIGNESHDLLNQDDKVTLIRVPAAEDYQVPVVKNEYFDANYEDSSSMVLVPENVYNASNIKYEWYVVDGDKKTLLSDGLVIEDITYHITDNNSKISIEATHNLTEDVYSDIAVVISDENNSYNPPKTILGQLIIKNLEATLDVTPADDSVTINENVFDVIYGSDVELNYNAFYTNNTDTNDKYCDLIDTDTLTWTVYKKDGSSYKPQKKQETNVKATAIELRPLNIKTSFGVKDLMGLEADVLSGNNVAYVKENGNLVFNAVDIAKISLSLEGRYGTAETEIEVNAIPIITGIEASYTGEPVLTGNDYDETKVSLKKVMNDGTKENLDIADVVIAPNSKLISTVGDNTFDVTLDEFSSTFTVIGYKKVIGIETIYNGNDIIIGNDYDEDDIEINKIMHDNSKEALNYSDITVNPESKTIKKVGDNEYKVTYDAFTTSFHINGLNDVIGIEASYTGDAVLTGSNYDVSKVILKKLMKDGTKEDLSYDDVTVNPDSTMIYNVGNNTFEVEYKGFKTTFIVIGKKQGVGLEIIYHGDAILTGYNYDKEDVEINMIMHDTSKVPIAYDDVTVTPSSTKINNVGNNLFNVSYDEFSSTFTVVGYKEVTGIEASYTGNPILTGNMYNEEDVVLHKLMHDNTKEVLAYDDVVISPNTKVVKNIGDNTFDVTYGNFDTIFVVQGVLGKTGITAEYKGEDIIIGKDYNKADVEVYFTYHNGSKSEKITSFLVNSTLVQKVGKNEYTATCESFTDTFEVTGYNNPESISFIYHGKDVPVGDLYSKSDVTAQVTYSNGDKEILNDDEWEASSLIISKPAANSFTGTFQGLSSSFTVNGYYALEAISVSYNGLPIEIVGNYNKEDVIVTAHYRGTDSKIIATEDWTENSLTVQNQGINTFTATYSGMSADYEIIGLAHATMTAEYNGPDILVGSDYKKTNVKPIVVYKTLDGVVIATKTLSNDEWQENGLTVAVEGLNPFIATYKNKYIVNGMVTANYNVTGYTETNNDDDEPDSTEPDVPDDKEDAPIKKKPTPTKVSTPVSINTVTPPPVSTNTVPPSKKVVRTGVASNIPIAIIGFIIGFIFIMLGFRRYRKKNN